jgi:predicted permease
MAATALAIAPVFLLIVFGAALRRVGIPSDDFWSLTDRLVYFVLMPALFFVRIAEADLADPDLLSFTATLYGGFAIAIAAGLGLAALLRQGPAAATSLAQGAGRFNTFIGLAVAEALYATPGLQAAVLGATVLVPFVNLVCVGLFALRLPQPGRGLLWGAVRGLATNPLILAIGAGVGVNLALGAPIPILHETLGLLGQAALPIMLLCVGASLKPAGLGRSLGPLAAAAVAKLGLFPLAVIAFALALDLDPLKAQVALIFGALPTGVAAYTLARQLGGDAPLMAGMITVQTALAFAVLPAWLALGGWLFWP